MTSPREEPINETALGPRMPSETLERLRKVVDWFLMVNNPRTWRPDAPGCEKEKRER